MNEITLGQIESILLWLTGFGGGIAIIVKAVKKAIEAGFKPVNEQIIPPSIHLSDLPRANIFLFINHS